MFEIAFSTYFGLLCMTNIGRLDRARGEHYERVQASINDPGTGVKNYIRPLTSFYRNGHLLRANNFRYFPHCPFADKDIGNLSGSINSLITGIPNNDVFPKESEG